jgi:hypothetical protein
VAVARQALPGQLQPQERTAKQLTASLADTAAVAAVRPSRRRLMALPVEMVARVVVVAVVVGLARTSVAVAGTAAMDMR